ncbi:methylmalonyl-CoA mutase [Aquamicrobium lusatiense]|uniref:Methylmalonyl-CoA mutase n=1 Tax=Aquamicrobium lusatiense TaxID=89772 RepID=A0A7W9S1P1_9HYPH|nr:methylmalonyl-CoA mutase family protein [Aquamicrobium lusatiense]MBB6012290.1 methylmalonyl-CoA mutase [Aquamicrobium lusatiense]
MTDTAADRHGQDNRWKAIAEQALGDGAIAPASGKPRWAICQRIDDPDVERARAQIADDLAQGATGLALVFDGAPNAFGYGLPGTPQALGRILEDVPLDRIYLRLDVHPASRAMADWLVGSLGKGNIDPSRLNLSFGIDPAATFAGTGRLRMTIEALQASMPQSLAYFFAMDVPGILLEADGRVLHNAGATEAQELGAMLASAAAHLRLFQEARQALVYAAPHIGFAVGVDDDALASAAKIKALRLLWARLQESFSISPTPTEIHAETSMRIVGRQDLSGNVARNAAAVFGAAAGGADSIAVLPHTIAHGLPEGNARRIARNLQMLVAQEQADLSDVDELVEDFCQQGWAEFQRIEQEGGILPSLKAGHIQSRVKTSASQRRTVSATQQNADAAASVPTLSAERHPAPTDGVVFCEALHPLLFDGSVETVAQE